MNLVVDIGNTRTKVYVFEGEEIVESKTVDELKPGHPKSFKNDFPGISKAIVSSVKDFPDGLKFEFRDFEIFIELNPHTPLPVKNLYKTKETLGNDRLAAVVGANYLYPAADLLVIDAGTAITYDFIDKAGNYLGGSISPGINMRFQALNHFTGRLPLVGQHDEDSFIGTTTETAIRIGVQQGVIYEAGETIEKFRKFYKNLGVIITGGDVHFFDKNLKSSFFVNSNLVGIGLNRILNYNGEI
jgi:type III pantothenate kinase